MRRFGALIAFVILCIAVASAFAAEPPAPMRSIPFDATAEGEPIPAGAFGYGMMQTREMLADFCPKDADYGACRDILMRELAPRVRALGARALSYSWGGGDDRNALGTYSDPLAGKSPWGGALGLTPEDFRAFAKAAGAEAVAFGVPIRGMVPLLKWIPPGARAATVAYGEAMKRALGCGEDFHCYGQMGGEMTWLGGWNAAADHLALQEALARALAGPGLTWTLYGLDWFPARDPRLINIPVYELTTKLLGQGFPVAIDLHEYHARPHWTGAASVDLDNPEVRGAVLSIGAKRAGFMRVAPAHWGARGEPAPGVILEFALEAGKVGKNVKTPCIPPPFDAQIAEAGILFQAVAERALPALAWSLANDDERRGGWCYGALANREPTQRARTLEFVARDLRGDLLTPFSDGALQGFVVRRADGAIVLTGGNFSLETVSPVPAPKGRALRPAEIQVYDEAGERRIVPGGAAPFEARPATLFRVIYKPAPNAVPKVS